MLKRFDKHVKTRFRFLRFAYHAVNDVANSRKTRESLLKQAKNFCREKYAAQSLFGNQFSYHLAYKIEYAFDKIWDRSETLPVFET